MAHTRGNLRITQTVESKHSTSIEEIRSRLKKALAGQSCRTIGLRTNTHPETVRRYLSVGHPSVEFVCGIARAYEVSCDWLMLGIGPVKPRDKIDHLMRSAPLSQLLRGVSEKLETAEEKARLLHNEKGTRLRMTQSSEYEIARTVRIASSILLSSTST